MSSSWFWYRAIISEPALQNHVLSSSTVEMSDGVSPCPPPSCLSVHPLQIRHFKLLHKIRVAAFRIFRRKRLGFREAMKLGGWWQSTGDSPEKVRSRKSKSFQKGRSKSAGNASELEEQSEEFGTCTSPITCSTSPITCSMGFLPIIRVSDVESRLDMVGEARDDERVSRVEGIKKVGVKESAADLEDSPTNSLLRKTSSNDGRVRSIEKLRQMMSKAPSERMGSLSSMSNMTDSCQIRQDSVLLKVSSMHENGNNGNAVTVEEQVEEGPIIELLKIALDAKIERSSGTETGNADEDRPGKGSREADSASSRLVAIRKAAESLWNMTKISKAVRRKMVDLGAITALLPLLGVQDAAIQEYAATVLLNLALESEAKVRMVAEEAIVPLLNIVRNGASVKARENAVGAVCSLSVSSEGRRVMVEAGAVNLLVKLFASGSTMARKDAGLGLFNLAIDPQCRDDIIDAGAVRVILEVLESPGVPGVEEEVMALLSVLSKSPEAVVYLEKRNSIRLLVSVLEEGATEKTRVNAAACLLQVAAANEKCIILIKQEGGVFPLLPLSQSNSARGREKATALLSLLRASQTTV